MKQDITDMSLNVLRALDNVLVPEEERLCVEQVEPDNSDYLVASLIALRVHFEGLLPSIRNMDLIEFTHFLNKLAIQFIFDDSQEE